MSDADRPTAKRSRFDQMEPEPKRPSRFDRRSRSPPARRTPEARDRSPLPRDASAEAKKSPSVDPAAAAAAAAARINAQLQARKGIQHVDVPPIQKPDQSPTPPTSATASATSGRTGGHRKIDGEMYVSDGDYIKDIEVNDLRNRYTLTKGATQQMIKDETGADVTTRGSYYPNKNMATPSAPPLYLHITSRTKEGLEAAVAKIEDLIQQELPQLVDERRFRRRDQEQPQVERDEYGRRKWPEEKITVGLESLPGFNIRAQIVGAGGAYVKHIQSETGCRVQIKGRGSGYLENATGRESEEDMFLHVTGPDAQMVEKGKELCEDLISSVREQYEAHKSRPPRERGGYGGGDRYGGGDHYRGGGRSQESSYGYGRQGSDHAAAPGATAAAPGTAGAANSADWSQYSQYYAGGGQDPYAAYGGYQNYVAWYYYYQQQAQGQGQQGGDPAAAPPPPPSDSAPPPPPPSDAPPAPPGGNPPPPPPPPGGSGYNALAGQGGAVVRMSHQRYPSHDPIKEPHSVSVKVLRQRPHSLSRPSLVAQYPVDPPLSSPGTLPTEAPGSLAYASAPAPATDTNPAPFVLSPILNLPVSFGSAYVGETFSCTLCANNDLAPGAGKQIRDVRIEAEMKTPGLGAAHKLDLGPSPPGGEDGGDATAAAAPAAGVDLEAGGTLQKVVSFDLKEEGNHVLAVTVSYYEATETSGRTRTFRKLYQFICKASLIVRTKVGILPPSPPPPHSKVGGAPGGSSSRWVLEAQLENCSEDVVQLEKVAMELEDGFRYQDCNWEASGSDKPVLQPGEVEQVCFLVEQVDGGPGTDDKDDDKDDDDSEGGERPPRAADGRITFGVLGIGWRGEMGNRGFLSTGRLGARVSAR
ncbi:hypothetical protein O9K51_05534 [Purpureocillium lavendulum]|uniref:K Homology domain-containing protein n=1 Tax=Purpureocillium lavendulum TaxID=1247861 RepID=A0AB34FSB0_9HYPO|nr:hypothetical protein O9K51_05534 [Purpureocillium lavendulum]